MTSEQYEQHENEHCQFDRVKNKLSHRPDLHAFNLLDKLVPGTGDIVGAACHDQIWLSVEPEELAMVATEDEIVELIRCGVFFDTSADRLSMYV